MELVAVPAFFSLGLKPALLNTPLVHHGTGTTKVSRLEPMTGWLGRGAAKPPSGPGWVHEIKHDGYP
jgi:hypothetical protein